MMRDEDADVLHRILATRDGFGHREHLELAWSYLTMHPSEEAERAMGSAIRHVAELHGVADRYHDTLTRSWLRLVAVHRGTTGACSFEEFITENPGLLDRAILDGHYSADVLWSSAARRGWVAPDLLALPTHL